MPFFSFITLLAFFISFDRLEEAQQGQQVTVRGFLYQTAERKLILAPQPALKSCCIGHAERQILIESHFENPSQGRVYEVTGILVKEEKGYLMKEATIK